MPSYQNSRRYNSKSHISPAQRRSGFRNPAAKPTKYRKYYHQQPSKMVYVEEPDSEAEEESEESDFQVEASDYDTELSDDEEVYEFDLSNPNEQYSDDSSSEDEEQVYIIDMNDELENDAIDMLEAEGQVYDLNDELVRYYGNDSESESESESDSSSESESDSESDSELDEAREPEDILDIIDLNDQLQAEALRQIAGEQYGDDSESQTDSDMSVSESESESESESSDSSSSSDSESESEIEYSTNPKTLRDQLVVENVRQAFEENLVSDDELTSSDEDSELGSEPEYIDIDSDIEVVWTSDEEEYDAGNPENYEYDESDTDSDSDSDSDEGYTIYKHKFDLPDFDSEEYSTDEELVPSEDEAYNDIGLLRANDSDDEVEVIDLSKDLENSKDCELVELDENTYKLNLRFPSIVKDELKIDFLKNQNELIIRGKFNFNNVEDSEEESDSEDQDGVTAEAVLVEESDDEENDKDYEQQEANDADEPFEWSGFEGQETSDKVERGDILSDESNSDSESESSSSSESESESDSDSTSDSESDSDSDSETEEIQEDAESLIREFKNQEISFEKHFQFDKLIKFDEIKAKFINDDELELIIPNENSTVNKNDNIVSIPFEVVEEADEEQSATDEIEEPALVVEATEDVVME